MFLVSSTLALVAQTQTPNRPPFDLVQQNPPNILVVVLDDMGVDMVGAYDEAPIRPPCTPNIDTLAASGILFRNAYTNPWCSPTRSQILTGRHGFRTGLGIFMKPPSPGLSVQETIIPEGLPWYSSAAVGKWHLANPVDNGDGQGLDHPRNSGFDYYAGSFIDPTSPFYGPCCPPGCLPGEPHDYFDWVKTTNGTEACTNLYMTIDTADDAIARAQVLPEPWFLYVAFNAVHTPTHDPPAALCQSAVCPDPPFPCPTTPQDTVGARTRAMVQALDAEVGRMLAAIFTIDPNVYVFLLGDNGTIGMASQGMVGGCFDPLRAKGKPYEAGINVPFIVAGPGVPTMEVQALVSSTDIFATCMDLGYGIASAEDSVSLLPYLQGSTVPQRQTVYAETFQPNGLPLALTVHDRTIRNDRYKLIRFEDFGPGTPMVRDEFYDLVADPCESNNLLGGPLTTEEQDNYFDLNEELVAMGVD